MAGLNEAIDALVRYLLEPDAMRPDNLLGGIELPHRPIGWNTANRQGDAPELDAIPERSDLPVDQADVEIADPIHGIGYIDNPHMLVQLANFERVDAIGVAVIGI